MNDVWSGVIKAAVFGLILTLTGCIRGYFRPIEQRAR